MISCCTKLLEIGTQEPSVTLLLIEAAPENRKLSGVLTQIVIRLQLDFVLLSGRLIFGFIEDVAGYIEKNRKASN